MNQLRKQSMVEVVTQTQGGWISSGTTDAVFVKVVGFEQSSGNISKVKLQDTGNGKVHSFPVQQIKVCHISLQYFLMYPEINQIMIIYRNIIHCILKQMRNYSAKMIKKQDYHRM